MEGLDREAESEKWDLLSIFYFLLSSSVYPSTTSVRLRPARFGEAGSVADERLPQPVSTKPRIENHARRS
jgi:hypothetical protein